MADDNKGSEQSGNPESNNSTPAPMVIPEAYRSEKSLQTFKTHEDFVKSHLELNKKLGSAVWLPGEKDDEVAKSDKLNRIHRALGKPENFDGYNAEKLVGGSLAAEQINELRNFAFANNFNQSQFDAAADFLNNLHAHSVEQLQAQANADEEQMRKDWGDALFRSRAGLARSAIVKLGGDELSKIFADRGLGSHPKLVEIFADIGQRMLEDNALDAHEVPGAITKAEAQKKINEVLANKDDIYHRKFSNRPGHKERVEEMNGWFKIVHAT